MTEVEWIACGAPCTMLEFMNQGASERKLRLFAHACCMRISRLLPLSVSTTALKVLEKYADGLASDEELIALNRLHRLTVGREPILATGAVEAAIQVPSGRDWPLSVLNCAIGAAGNSAWAAAGVAIDGGQRPTQKQQANKAIQDAMQSGILREIFGNPFRPMTVNPAWLTSDVRLLATGIYDEKAFDRMPILADALQDGGCDNDDILNHLRDATATHVRGCWALDLVLGKE